MTQLTSWLIKEPVGGVVMTFDKYILAVYKLFYLTIRIILGIILGKEKRNTNTAFKKLFPPPDTCSPSFQLCLFFDHILRILTMKGMTTTRIYVPKYSYKVYCPLNKEDFINLTIREEDILEHYNVKEGDIVIDVGAHIGRYSLISAKRVGTNGRVVAIEADPSVFVTLNKNINLNNITNTVTLNYAAYSKETKLKLFIPDEKLAHTIYNTINSERAPSKNFKNFVEVNANTLDKLMQKTGIILEEIRWIKIDVEGAELEVLKGSIEILEKSKDLSLLIEIHNITDNTNLYKPIMELLKEYHFKTQYKKIHESGEIHIIVKKGEVA